MRSSSDRARTGWSPRSSWPGRGGGSVCSRRPTGRAAARGASSSTLPGFVHDVCSAIHPLGIASPALRDLDLARRGSGGSTPTCRWATRSHRGGPPCSSARSTATAAGPRRRRPGVATAHGPDGACGARAERLAARPARPAAGAPGVAGPLRPGRHPPRDLARTALRRRPGTRVARRAVGPLGARPGRTPSPAGSGCCSALLAHVVGWPMAEGGSQSIADALVDCCDDAGGEVRCGERVDSLSQLPPARAVLLRRHAPPARATSPATGPAGALPTAALGRYRYGPGVFKVDWALDGPVPWTDPALHRAGTVHLGGTADEVRRSEHDVTHGRHPERAVRAAGAAERRSTRPAPPRGTTRCGATATCPTDPTST